MEKNGVTFQNLGLGLLFLISVTLMYLQQDSQSCIHGIRTSFVPVQRPLNPRPPSRSGRDPRRLKPRYVLQLSCIIRYLPPMLALYATPTPQYWLKATAATSPAQRVPCLLSPLSRGIGSESLPLMSYEASGSYKEE
uniref:Uncharacterized protein n=1 Tax=Anopheles culicifacies TaxID=139723 RepID=A0A182MS54_9DIPT